MKKARILIVEDSNLDFELIRRELRKCSYPIEAQQIDSLSELQKALKDKSWNLVITDFNLPEFNALDVLQRVSEAAEDIPTILVSGAVGEENAIEAMRSGASDFILKKNLSRLVPALERELKEVELRQEKRAMEAALRESDAFNRSIIETAEEGIWVLDLDQKLTFVNDKLCRLMNVSRDGLIGASPMSLLVPEDRDSFQQALECVELGERVQAEWRFMRAAGEWVYTIVSVVPILDDLGRGKGSFAMITDITARKQAESAIEAANQAKSKFLSTMSHEIRTPLAVIVGFAELALNNKQSESERANALLRIKRNAETLTDLVNDLLDLSKIEAEKLELELRRFRLIDLLNDLVESFQLKAREKNLRLFTEFASDLPDHIYADPTRLRQVLTNLLGNAVKFTERGWIILSAELQGVQNGVARVSFAVEDTGIGMTPHQVGRLFQPFSQADLSISRKHGGTGLGLALSKRLGELMGGTVELDSTGLGRGSRFGFNVPLQVANSKKEIQRPERHVRLEAVKILIVDDSVDNQDLVRRYLEKAGAQVTLASDGNEGIRRAVSDDPDLILMDIQMPIKDGFTAIRELRQMGFNRPVVALSAFALKEERDRALECGFSDYLTKPVKHAVLISKIAEFTQLQVRSARARQTDRKIAETLV